MLSKMLYPLGYEPKNEFITETPYITYKEYMSKKIDLNKYKIPQLKLILKSIKNKTSGTKVELIRRISDHFEKCAKIVNIQKVFRGHIVRISMDMRGEGFRERTKCVNGNDFYTLEPLDEIPYEYFFSFTCGKFTYGCNIISLIHLIKNTTVVKNPYNRDYISTEIIQTIFKLYNLIKILYGFPDDVPIINSKHLSFKNINETHIVRDNILSNINNVLLDRQAKIIAVRVKPYLTRVRELFMEMDQLGNYTQPEWFLNLERREYIRLFRTLHDIWSYRANLSREMKQMICILGDPFREVYQERIYLNDSPIDVLCEICLKIFESMVYCGIDDEYRKIGTLHALTALTIVSNGARNSLPWLYESLYG
jgi:hypothetical protein